MESSPPTPPEGVTDADWVEQQESTDPLDELDAGPTVRVRRTTVEANEADLAEQDVVVPLDPEE